LIPDNAKEMVQGDMRREANKAQMPIHPIEAYKPNENLAKDCIRETKRLFTRAMTSKNTPAVIWDRCFVCSSCVRRKVAWNIRRLNGQTPVTVMTGDSDDISAMAEFGWYDWIWYHHPVTDGLTLSKKRMGRYIGPSFSSGAAMCAAWC
jgi:NAD-dependent dihydropyrimidine dehydrogenase PreA subunit